MHEEQTFLGSVKLTTEEIDRLLPEPIEGTLPLSHETEDGHDRERQ